MDSNNFMDQDNEIKPSINWFSIEKDGYPNYKCEVLTWSPSTDDLFYRIIDSQFLKYTSDVTHWAYLTKPI